MKKIISLLILLTLCLTLFGCQKENALPTFEVGKKVSGVVNDNFEMFISVNGTLTNDKATMQITLTMEKELNITNNEDYIHYGNYNKYLYSVSIKGNVSNQYFGKSVYVDLIIAPEYHCGRGGGTVISNSGDFVLNYTFTSNAVLTEWTPTKINIT